MILAAVAFQVAVAMPYLELGDFAQARPVLEKACVAREENACYLLGRTLFSLDAYREALSVLVPLRKTDAAPWRVEDALALIYEAMRQPVDAEAMYRLAVAGSQKRSADPASHYGRFLMREGRAMEAVALLGPVVQRFPRHQLSHFELGRAFYQMGRLADAEASLLQAPGIEEARLLLAKVRRQREAARP